MGKIHFISQVNIFGHLLGSRAFSHTGFSLFAMVCCVSALKQRDRHERQQISNAFIVTPKNQSASRCSCVRCLNNNKKKIIKCLADVSVCIVVINHCTFSAPCPKNFLHTSLTDVPHLVHPPRNYSKIISTNRYVYRSGIEPRN